MAKTAFILLIGVACALAGTSNDLGWRIIGGSKADDGQFPYQISLRYGGSHSCGGSIIDETTILCAAHCVDGRSPDRMTVVTGSNKLNAGGSSYKVLKIVVHPDWNAYELTNDVSILKVEKIELGPTVSIIDLETGKTPGDVACVLSGWGSTYLGGSSPNELQWIKLQTHDIESCKKAHAPGMKVIDSEICTFTKRGEGACHGDSGGPLVNSETGKQIGIVSWGQPCAVGKPDVFTRVESFVDWIREASKPSE